MATCVEQPIDLGNNFAVVRKNTFLEVVPKEAWRGRGAMSEPSRSRETTPQPMQGLLNDSCQDQSPSTTPQLSTRNLNQAPVWSNFQPFCEGFQPVQYVQGCENNMEWVPGPVDEFGQMYCMPQQGQWVYWDGQPMQVQFVPFEGDANQFQDYDCDELANAPTTAGSQNPSSAGSDALDPSPNGSQDGSRARWIRPDGNGFNRDTRRADRPFPDRAAPRRVDGVKGPDREKAKGEKKRKPRLSKTGGGKVFVGGLASKTTEETLLKVFSQYGNVAQSNVLLDPASRRSRGFGYVTFVGEVPEGVVDRDHLIDGRLCGARLYKY